ncbi:MAG: indole-3-glycerol phosphate synthase TrpC [bacterium]
MAEKNSFLNRIVQSKRRKVECKVSEDSSLHKIKEKAKKAPPPYDFYRALSKNRHLSLIAEIKRASPSKGAIKLDMDPAYQARSYQDLGASAISVLTEEDYFHGSIEDLIKARLACTIPILRKDFIIHPYQVYEARAFGADAILLIAALLSEQDLLGLVKLGDELEMYSLVEVHSEEEIPRTIKSGTKIIGINNRDLSTFHVNIETTARLIPFIPKDRLVVSESGINGVEEAKRLCSLGIRSILVGEALVTSPDLGALMGQLTRLPIINNECQ